MTSSMNDSSSSDDAKKSTGSKKVSLTVSRRMARTRALQALYQAEMNPTAAVALVKQFYDGQNDMSKVDADYFQELVHQCLAQQQDLDALFQPFLQIRLDQLDPVERCVLRLSCYELKSRLDVPKRVAINEGVELAKKYGAEDGHKFVNGVLDKLANQLRQHEK